MIALASATLAFAGGYALLDTLQPAVNSARSYPAEPSKVVAVPGPALAAAGDGSTDWMLIVPAGSSKGTDEKHERDPRKDEEHADRHDREHDDDHDRKKDHQDHDDDDRPGGLDRLATPVVRLDQTRERSKR